MKSMIFCVCAALCWTSGAQTAAPEVTAEQQPQLTLSETVEVEERLPPRSSQSSIATRLPMTEAAIPASLSRVERERLLQQGAENLGDALRNVSGVNPQTGSGVFDRFVLRGFESVTGALILSDGAIEPESTIHHLYNIERVEVLKGAAGFLYGGRALAGTVNLVRKQPAASNFTEVGLYGGSNSTIEAAFDINRDFAERRQGLRINGFWRQSDNHRERNDSTAWAINPVFNWRLGESTTASLSLEAAESEYRPDSGLPVFFGNLLDLPRERNYSSPFDFSVQRVTRLQLDLEHRLSDSLRWREKIYFTSLDWRSDGTLIVGVSPGRQGGIDVLRTQTELDDQQSFAGLQIDAVLTLESGAFSHQLIAGLEVQRLADDFTLGVAFLPSVDAFHPVETAQLPLFPIPGQGLAVDGRSVVIAPYVLDQISFSDLFQVVLGARLDIVDYQADGTVRSDRDDSQLSPLVAIVGQPLEQLSLYVQYAESFEPPSTLTVGEIEPEEGQQIEVGAKLDLADGRLRLNLSLYQIERSNLSIPDSSGITGQQGDQRSRGAEFELYARLAEGFDCSFTYAFTEAELVEFAELVVFGPGPTDFFIADYSGNAAAFAPRHLASLWLSKRFPNGLGIAGGARYLGEQYAYANNALELGEAVIVDASLSYHRGPTSWRLVLKNLTGEDYFTQAFGAFSARPAAGFEGFGGVRHRF